MTRVVADTNIYDSAVMFAGLPGSLLDLGLRKAFTLVISPPLLDELEDKLRVKFGVTPKDAATIRAKLEGVADVVVSDFILDLVKDDPDDNRVLECAVAGKVDYIVSAARRPRFYGGHNNRSTLLRFAPVRSAPFRFVSARSARVAGCPSRHLFQFSTPCLSWARCSLLAMKTTLHRLVQLPIPPVDNRPPLPTLPLGNRFGVLVAQLVLATRAAAAVNTAGDHRCLGSAASDLAGSLIPTPPQLDGFHFVGHFAMSMALPPGPG